MSSYKPGDNVVYGSFSGRNVYGEVKDEGRDGLGEYLEIETYSSNDTAYPVGGVERISADDESIKKLK